MHSFDVCALNFVAGNCLERFRDKCCIKMQSFAISWKANGQDYNVSFLFEIKQTQFFSSSSTEYLLSTFLNY